MDQESIGKRSEIEPGQNTHQPQKRHAPPLFCDRPRCLLTVSALAIFVAEFLVMITVGRTAGLSPPALALLDATLVTLLVLPALYLLLFRPITLHIRARQRIEREQERLIKELSTALAEVKTLSGLLPICANCKKIRDDEGYWNRLEEYLATHGNIRFSHGICPDCLEKLYPEFAEGEGKPKD